MRFEELPTPCYVVDEGLIEKNLKILNGVMKRTGCKIILAQKAFSMTTHVSANWRVLKWYNSKWLI